MFYADVNTFLPQIYIGGITSLVLPVSEHVPAIKELNLATSGGFGAVDNEQLLNWKLTYNTYCATDETQSIAGKCTTM